MHRRTLTNTLTGILLALGVALDGARAPASRRS